MKKKLKDTFDDRPIHQPVKYEIPLKKNRTKKKFTKKLKSPSNLHEKSRIN